MEHQYSDVIMSVMAFQITSLTIVYLTVCQAQIKENIRAPRHWPLWGEFIGTGDFPTQRASNAENVSIDDIIICTNPSLYFKYLGEKPAER